MIGYKPNWDHIGIEYPIELLRIHSDNLFAIEFKLFDCLGKLPIRILLNMINESVDV